MPAPNEIRRPKLLLVEGPDAFHFFCNFLEKLGVSDVHVASFGGVDELPAWLRLLQRTPGFVENVQVIGIVRDAEGDAAAAFRAVCRALSGCGLPTPEAPGQKVGSRPVVSVFILPGSEPSGMLETLCLQAVANDPAVACVEAYLSCLGEVGIPVKVREKARFFAFLASRPEPGKPHGVALKAGYLCFESPAYASLKDFLHSL